MASDCSFIRNVGIDAQHKRHPDQHHRDSAVAAQLEADPQNQGSNNHHGNDLPRNRLADAKLSLYQNLADPEQNKDQSRRKADAHTSNIEFFDKVFSDQPGQKSILFGKHTTEI